MMTNVKVLIDRLRLRTPASHCYQPLMEEAADAIEALCSNPTPSSSSGWEYEEKLTVEEAWTILCETPDITSPEEYPDHALITMEQLGSFMDRAIPVGTITCPCTTFEQDEYCPVGFPSLLCSACDGKGVVTIDQVVALAAEMLKVAEQVDELEDPFAAWESIELLKSQAPKDSPVSIVGGSVEDFATRLFSLPGFMLRETYKGKPAVTVTFPTEQDADQFHLTLAELSMHRNKEDD